MLIMSEALVRAWFLRVPRLVVGVLFYALVCEVVTVGLLRVDMDNANGSWLNLIKAKCENHGLRCMSEKQYTIF